MSALCISTGKKEKKKTYSLEVISSIYEFGRAEIYTGETDHHCKEEQKNLGNTLDITGRYRT